MVVRTFNQFSGGRMFGLQKIIESACTTVTYAPMLSVLFLGTRMRAIQLTQGQTEKYQLPQPWVQTAMFVCTYAVLAQVLLVLGIGIFAGQEVPVDDEGNLDVKRLEGGKMLVMGLSIARYLVMAAL